MERIRALPWSPSGGRRAKSRAVLAAPPGEVPRPPLTDIEPPSRRDLETSLADALDMVLVAADAGARAEDYEGALRWLEAAERLNVMLPIEYARRRCAWRHALAEQRQTG